MSTETDSLEYLSGVLSSEEFETFMRAVDPPPGGLTPARMVELDLLHAQRLFNRDFDGIREKSLIANPVYERFPRAVQLNGIDAVRASHEGTILGNKELRDKADVKIRSVCFGHNTMTIEWSRMIGFPDGTRKRCYGIAVVSFEGDRLIGERVYTDGYLGELQDQVNAGLYERPDVIPL